MDECKHEEYYICPQLTALRKELEDWRNAEGSLCPEDVGFVEYIQALRKENENYKKRYIEAVSDMAALKRKIKQLLQALTEQQ